MGLQVSEGHSLDPFKFKPQKDHPTLKNQSVGNMHVFPK